MMGGPPGGPPGSPPPPPLGGDPMGGGMGGPPGAPLGGDPMGGAPPIGGGGMPGDPMGGGMGGPGMGGGGMAPQVPVNMKDRDVWQVLGDLLDDKSKPDGDKTGGMIQSGQPSQGTKPSSGFLMR